MDASEQWALDGESDAYRRHVEQGCRRAGELAAQIRSKGLGTVLPELRQAWVETELPSQCPQAWRTLWHAVRDAPGGHEVMSVEEQARQAGLPQQVTVYRGCGQGGERGWSWTLDRSVAEDFAVRYHEMPGVAHGVLCVAQVDAQDVIACLDVEDEHEVILDPDALDWDQVSVEAVGP